MGADLVIVNGKVVTVDENGTVAEAVAVKDGNIVAVGTTKQVKELANSGTKVIDLKGRLMLPGFIDTHEHCIRRGLQLDWVNCKSPPMRSLGDVIEALRMKAETKPNGEWS